MLTEQPIGADDLLKSSVKKLLNCYYQEKSGVGNMAAAQETIKGIVKKYMEDYPEIDDVDVIFRGCRPNILIDYNMVTQNNNTMGRTRNKKELNTIVVKSTLSDSQLQQIFELLKVTFYDLPFFDSLISEKLWLFLQNSNNIEITEQSTKRCVERYYDVTSFDDPLKPERKIVLNQIRLVFKCCNVLILGYHDLLRSFKCSYRNTII